MQKNSTHQPAKSCEIRSLTIRPGASPIKGVRVPEVARLSPAHTQYAIPKEAGSRWECTLVSSKTPAQPRIPAESTAHWGIFSQSKAKDFRMCYFGFIATKKPAVRLRRPHTGRREMTSKPCKILKKDGAPYRGSGFDQLDGYCIGNTPAPSCPPPPVCRHAPKTIFTQSLVNSRLSLVHLSVTLTFQRIGQRGHSYRLPTARIRLPFARCPCTKTAICAVAVNHPHHINHMSHSSDKCQPALVHALIPVNPSIRRARPSPATRLPSCAQNCFCPISRELSSISRPSLGSADISKNWTKRRLLQAVCGKNPTAIRPVLVHEARDLRRRRQSSPSHKLRKSQFKQMSTCPSTSAHTCATHPSVPRGPHSPRAATRAAFASHPSAVMRPKLLCPISRELSSISRPSLGSVDISKNWTKRRLPQVACGKNPTAIRPVPMHEARDLRRRR